jgi:hypothetical protein
MVEIDIALSEDDIALLEWLTIKFGFRDIKETLRYIIANTAKEIRIEDLEWERWMRALRRAREIKQRRR